MNADTTSTTPIQTMSEPAPAASADTFSGYELVLLPNKGWFNVDLQSIWHYRDLLSLMVWRDFVAKYKQTILGPLWFIIQPVLLTLVFTVIFGQVAKLPTDGLPPMLFYLCGQLGWNYFSQNFGANSAVLLNNAGLFGKVYFPRLVVPISTLISNLLAFAIQVVTFFAFFCYFKFALKTGGFWVDWHIVFLPLLVVQTAAFSLGVGLVLSALTAKYRDLTHLCPLLIQIWMYGTPVIYPLSKVPAAWRWLVLLNPMTSIVESFRLMLLGTGTVTLGNILQSCAITLVVLIAGVLLFDKVEKDYVDTV